ncbi:MAG: GNAT family N-acetyltransferase [Anaerolineales bacterium]
MIEITPIQPDQVAEAKDVIYAVAQRIFAPEQTVEEFIKAPDSQHWLDDLEDYPKTYAGNHGLLLVALDNGKVIGTAGVQKLTDNLAELKRIWLLESYHGQKIGFRMVSILLNFARTQGCATVYLETTRLNTRALAFYKELAVCRRSWDGVVNFKHDSKIHTDQI